MSNNIELFSTPQNQQRVNLAAERLTASVAGDVEHSIKNALGKALKVIGNNGAEFDRNCQVSIDWNGNQLLGYLDELHVADRIKLESVLVMLYRFILEFNLSVKYELSGELSQLTAFVNKNIASFSGHTQEDIIYARQQMPLSMLKVILNNEELGNLRNVALVSAQAQQKIDTWNASLLKSEANVGRLQDILDKQKDAFNFVGLHRGFADLEITVAAELKKSRRDMGIFGVLMIAPSAVDLALVVSGWIDFSKINIYAAIGAFVASVSLTLLFLYFFRISLRSADSCKAQLVQLRLRMTLCRFVQGYTEYSTEIKKQNPEALAKFENLIFSGIVGTEDKLPSTFDGIEQFAALVKAVKNN